MSLCKTYPVMGAKDDETGINEAIGLRESPESRDFSRGEVQKVAKELAVSVRSLQMYLKSEGTTYTKLLNEIQEAMAIDYLADRELSIDEIAYILGFTERSTFHKTFKKWTNFTPGEYRESKRRNKG